MLEESDKTNTKLSAECAGLKLQVQDLHDQVISQSSADDKVSGDNIITIWRVRFDSSSSMSFTPSQCSH